MSKVQAQARETASQGRFAATQAPGRQATATTAFAGEVSALDSRHRQHREAPVAIANSPRVLQQKSSFDNVRSSPRVVMQRMQLHGRGGGTAQRAEAGAGLQMPDVAHPVVQAVAAGGVVQLVKEAPASITVRFTTGKRVLSVTAAGGAELPFVMVENVKGNVAEGTVVLVWPGAKISSARFATTTSPIDEVLGSEKIKMVTIPIADDSKEEKARPSSSSSSSSSLYSAGPSSSSSSSSSPYSAGPSSSSSSSSSAPRPIRKEEVNVSAKGEIFSNVKIPITKFETKESGEAHVKKHGAEFGAEGIGGYLVVAQAFAREQNKKFCEAIIGNTTIRVDPPGMEKRRVLIVAGKILRTFYKHDPAFSSEPFTYAIYYTITKRMPLADLDPKILAMLEEHGVNVRAMEIEEIDRQLARGVPLKDIRATTRAPMILIEQRKRKMAEPSASSSLASVDDDSEPPTEDEET